MDTRAAQENNEKLEIATFGGGCFWCVEAVFEELEGVEAVVSGYAGGYVENPTYTQVCTGRTGHAEVCQIHYDPEKIKFEKLLEVFFKTHDPTTLNRQGVDVGTQYRSVIFYHDEQQQAVAEKYTKALDNSGAFRSKVVTEIAPLEKFYPAEPYHQDFYRRNPSHGYCRAHIVPKMKKFYRVFRDEAKER
jgi:peptide-methionine (S)-S-oxide reductase